MIWLGLTHFSFLAYKIVGYEALPTAIQRLLMSSESAQMSSVKLSRFARDGDLLLLQGRLLSSISRRNVTATLRIVAWISVHARMEMKPPTSWTVLCVPLVCQLWHSVIVSASVPMTCTPAVGSTSPKVVRSHVRNCSTRHWDGRWGYAQRWPPKRHRPYRTSRLLDKGHRARAC